MSVQPIPPTPNLDTVTTIRADGSRLFLHPADSRGRFTKARIFAALGLIFIYVALPWVQIDGYPALFLDVAERRFHFFGWVLAAQDMWLLFFLLTGVGFSLFFITALLGRIWCGWACPQTVFLEHVFRRVERWIEGDATKRRLLDAAPWDGDKVFKRVVKHTVFVVFAAGITHLLLAYFVSIPQLWAMMRQSPLEHWGAFLFVAIATAILYFNFAWFREQLCIVICPYGRLQSALIDDHSMVIGYDSVRGEPRGKIHAAGAGHCIDCSRCVQVCPTGIDIRQGLQIECIGCTACIDACDEVMDKLKRPRGLVRYDSFNGFSGKPTRFLRPRTVAYFLLLLAGIAVSSWAISTVKPASLTVTRMQGAPYYIDKDYVRNQFMVRLVNKRNETVRFSVSMAQGPDGAEVKGFEDSIEIAPLGEQLRPLVVQVPRSVYAGSTTMRMRLVDTTGRWNVTRQTEFIGPSPQLLKEVEQEDRLEQVQPHADEHEH
ncbi:MAG: cytochrome c oxidase accessory protein CcoG [Nibricoccus sp.]